MPPWRRRLRRPSRRQVSGPLAGPGSSADTVACEGVCPRRLTATEEAAQPARADRETEEGGRVTRLTRHEITREIGRNGKPGRRGCRQAGRHPSGRILKAKGSEEGVGAVEIGLGVGGCQHEPLPKTPSTVVAIATADRLGWGSVRVMSPRRGDGTD